MDEGTEDEGGRGAVRCLSTGHDAWVVGNEPVVIVNWHGATACGKQ